MIGFCCTEKNSEKKAALEKLMFLGLALILLLCVSGCSHHPKQQVTAGPSNKFFYYPSHKDFGTPQHINIQEQWIESRSGNTLHSQYWQQIDRAPKGLILHFHGNAGNLTDTREKVDWLFDEGWEIILFDYSGYGKSQGRPTPLTLRADAQSALDLARDIVLSQRRSSIINDDLAFKDTAQKASSDYRWIVIGTSLGGAVATDGIAQWLHKHTSLKPDMLVIDSSFASYIDTAKFVLDNKPLGGLFSWIAPVMLSDLTAPKLSATTLPDIPKLYVHCQQDQLIPEFMGKSIYNLATSPKTYWSLSDCAHARSFTNSHPQNQSLLLSILDNPHWLGTHLAQLPLLQTQPIATR